MQQSRQNDIFAYKEKNKIDGSSFRSAKRPLKSTLSELNYALNYCFYSTNSKLM